MKQSRWKSWALWASIAALIGLVVTEFCGAEKGGAVVRIIESVLACLAAFGIINNPTNKTGL